MRPLFSGSAVVRIICKILLSGSLTIVLIGSLSAQEDFDRIEEVDALFQSAIDSFTEGDFTSAKSGFDRILRDYPVNQRTTAAFVMKAKCQLSNREPLEAAKTLRTFMARFPGSGYKSDAAYTLGLALLTSQRYDSAVEAFMDSWISLRGSSAQEPDIVHALDAVIDSNFNVVKTRNLTLETPAGKQDAYLWLKIAEKHTGMSETLLAEAALDSMGAYAKDPLFAPRVAALRGVVGQKGSLRIGALLPLMKNDPSSGVRQIGEELLEGIQFAVDAYNADNSARTHVAIEVRDTERDPLVATRIVQELTSDPAIVAIIGPVFSNTASAVVGLTNARQIPLITPTANSNGIAAVGPFVFQANPDYETRGIAMARFAVEKQGHRRLAVLAPIDTYSKFMAEAFIKEALRLGASVLASEWYQRGQADFSLQLKNIRRAGLRAESPPMLSFTGTLTRKELAALVHLGVPMHTVDSLLERSAVIDAQTLLGPDARTLLDSVGIGTMVDVLWEDSLEIPVKGIDGFYIPVSMPEEIGIVASQLVYFNFHTVILGSGEWNSFPELDANKRYCRNVYFESDSYVNTSDPAYTVFVDSFFSRFRKRPTNYTLFGYDTANLLLSLVRSGATQREALQRALSAVTMFKGLHANIGLASRRVNSWIHVLQFDGERIHQVDQLQIR